MEPSLPPDVLVLVAEAVLVVAAAVSVAEAVLSIDVLSVDVLFADRVSETVVCIVPIPLIEVLITSSNDESATEVAAVSITASTSVVSELVKIASCEVVPSASEEELSTCRASCCAVST